MSPSRRKFLGRAGALGASAMVGNLGRWAVPAAMAQATGDYRALVCVFLFGGNDANNLVVPIDDYAQYAAVRTPASGIALAQAELLPFAAPRQGGRRYGFHPAFAPLQPVQDAGRLAVIANAGPLVAPITKADYAAGRNRPPNLFSHSDQQALWQGLTPDQAIRSGWGGRVADRIGAVNAGSQLPAVVSVSGAQLFGNGQPVGLGAGMRGRIGLQLGVGDRAGRADEGRRSGGRGDHADFHLRGSRAGQQRDEQPVDHDSTWPRQAIDSPAWRRRARFRT